MCLIEVNVINKRSYDQLKCRCDEDISGTKYNGFGCQKFCICSAEVSTRNYTYKIFVLTDIMLCCPLLCVLCQIKSLC